jgi:DNA polymerase bacteriophage-type
VRDSAPRKNAVKLGPLRLYMRQTSEYHKWLCIRLPSGRELRYFRPEVKMVDKWGNGRRQPALSYMGEFKGKPARESTYGGKLTENVVQAIARDVMIHSSFHAEDEGYTLVGRVHDELITEVEEDFGSKEHLEEILKRRPSWALDAPIGAEGFECIRYRK